MRIREPAVAGFFYPGVRAELERTVRELLAGAERRDHEPEALIVPHAGYVYSGPVAATGYASVRRRVGRVVLMGPAHRYPFRGVATHSADAFRTPLGDVRVEATPHLPVLDEAHVGEHSLEVHLPFLQVLFGDFTLVPLLVGEASPQEAGTVLEALREGPETLVVISSDLSHYHDYETAKRLDRKTAKAIVELRAEQVGPREACGCRAIGAMLHVAQGANLGAEILDLRSSGDTAGGKDEVVGYGAFAFR